MMMDAGIPSLSLKASQSRDESAPGTQALPPYSLSILQGMMLFLECCILIGSYGSWIKRLSVEWLGETRAVE